MEESLAVIERAPPALISSAPAVGSRLGMSEMLAATVVRIQLMATDPAPAMLSAVPAETAMAAICTFWHGGSSVGLENSASTVMPPVAARSVAAVAIAVTVSEMSLEAKATPSPLVPPKFKPALPASVAIDAVSTAWIVMLPLASIRAAEEVLPATWASTVLWMTLIENDPPAANPPPPDPDPPTTTLSTRAVSVALTSMSPAEESTRIPSIVALTMFLTSLRPIDAPIDAPPVEMTRVPAPDSIREESTANTAAPCAADTATAVPAGREMCASTLVRTKLSEIAPAPLASVPPPPPALALVICDDIAAGRSIVTSPTITLLVLTARACSDPVPMLVSMIGFSDPSSVSWSVRASLMWVSSITMA